MRLPLRTTIAMASAALVGACFLGCSSTSEPPSTNTVSQDVGQENPSALSKEHFEKISNGMTPEQVRRILDVSGPSVDNPKPDDVYELVWYAGEGKERKEIAVKFRGTKSIGKTSKNLEVPPMRYVVQILIFIVMFVMCERAEKYSKSQNVPAASRIAFMALIIGVLMFIYFMFLHQYFV